MTKRPRKAAAPAAPAIVGRNAPWSDVVTIGPATLYLGDCTEVMAALDEASVHAVVTDPPYELGFMGKAWDAAGGVASDPVTWTHARRLLTPGGHLVAFAGSRTYHRIAMAIERAEFEIRDQLMWLYGSGFPKSHDVSKALGRRNETGADAKWASEAPSKEWEGWGTALKPAHEPIALARKPFRGSVAANTLAHGTGAMNIDDCRCEDSGKPPGNVEMGVNTHVSAYSGARARVPFDDSKGRWPANVITDGSTDVLEAFPSSAREAIRFFYAAKASKAEREYGLATTSAITQRADAGAGDGGRGGAPRANVHPTVKPVALMAWLCRLITPPGGTVLEPFMGSGSTGIAAVRHGFRFVGIEQSPEYFEIARRRIAQAVADEDAMPSMEREITRAVRALQLDLLAGEVGK